MSVKHRLYLAAALALALGLWAIFYGKRTLRPVIAEVRWVSNVERVESFAAPLASAGAEFDIDPYLLAGLMYVESGGDVRAVSSADALGLMQLKLATADEHARRLGIDEPVTRERLLSDGSLNVLLGAAYLRWLLDYRDGDLEHALVSYNAGPGKVNQWSEGAGGWEAWRDARRAAGGSRVLAYARDAVRFGERFRARGRVPVPDEAVDRPPRDSAGFVRPGEPE